MQTDSFPDDENGAVLRSMAEQGIDLTISRLVDFAHLIPDEQSAHAFAKRAEALGFEVAVYEPDDEAIEDGETDWDVICSRNMVPTHASITQTESALGEIAKGFGGHADGW